MRDAKKKLEIASDGELKVPNKQGKSHFLLITSLYCMFGMLCDFVYATLLLKSMNCRSFMLRIVFLW